MNNIRQPSHSHGRMTGPLKVKSAQMTGNIDLIANKIDSWDR